jgi:hypothetical protein
MNGNKLCCNLVGQGPKVVDITTVLGWTSTHVGTMLKTPKSIEIASKYYKYGMPRLNQGLWVLYDFSLCKESVLISLPYCGMVFYFGSYPGISARVHQYPRWYLHLFVAVFLLLANFHQISTWKVWSRAIQRIFHGKKMTQLCQISNLKIFKSPESYDNFQKVAKSVEGFCFISTFISIK